MRRLPATFAVALLLLCMMSLSWPSESDDAKDCIDLPAPKPAPGTKPSKEMREINGKLMKATGAGDIQGVADAICRGANLDDDASWSTLQVKWWGVTALMLASRRGHFDVAELLLKNGANPNHEGELGNALLEASWSDSRIVKLLLEYGADANVSGFSRRTPLMRAALFGDLESARFLLEYGAVVSTRDEDGFTALMLAAKGQKLGEETSHSKVVRLLLERGADVNARGWKRDKTALMLASHNDQVETVKLLLAHPDIDVNQRNKKGKTALDVASGRETKSSLVQAGAKRGKDLDLQ